MLPHITGRQLDNEKKTWMVETVLIGVAVAGIAEALAYSSTSKESR